MRRMRGGMCTDGEVNYLLSYLVAFRTECAAWRADHRLIRELSAFRSWHSGLAVQAVSNRTIQGDVKPPATVAARNVLEAG
ncbi:hypothetical protein MHPYR_440060 [uncultured Mycobacterium sp.]|uniref:Uncharacterized protein n=1 Tax=uncultured Mycobacterium sp. TaxID=171292 RepID=A0A1Y5PNT0_9MYCO|nr:hypothetical protein MHPYR_440060 [uncultured Mycobacterium sp.]